MTDSPVPVGAVIAGKYRVERILGAGAMGVVLAARHMELLELRAIKLMLPAGQQFPESTERFLREARAAARLRSQHVAKVHDVGRLEDGAPYAVIEYLEGTDLKVMLDQRGVISVAEAATYLGQVCEAIGEAHAAGIVHRDLKPANLFLTRGPTGAPIVKVLDFGIAKMAAPDGTANDMTATSAMLGTPLYMSPEQMRGARDVDHRADIWALGVILYRMLTGTTPFTGGSLTEVCAAVVADVPRSPRSLRGDLSPDVEAVILRCLQKEPGQRYQSVAEFAAALSRAASSPSAGAVAPSPSPGGPSLSLMGTMLMDPPSANAPRTPPAAPPPAAYMTAGPAGNMPVASQHMTAGPAGNMPVASPHMTAGPSSNVPVSSPHMTAGPAGNMPFSSPQMTAGPSSNMPVSAQPPAANQAWNVPAWGAGQMTGPPAQAPGAQATWGAQAPAPPKPASRAGLFIGLGSVVVLAVAGGIAFLAWPSGATSSPAAGGSSAPVQSPGMAASSPGAQPTSSSGAKPSGRAATPTFGQSAPPSSGVATAPQPGAPGTTAAPPASTPAPAGASAKSLGTLHGILTSCWKDNEGANKGEPASSATATVTVGSSRSVLVSGPAKAKKGFTGCVVMRASQAAFDPSDTVVSASASLPAGP